MIDGMLSSQISGATAYTMIDNLLYLEAGAYGSFSSSTQNSFGIAGPERLRLNNPAPYWRVALQQNWKGHYFSLGHYGMSADVSLPGRDMTYVTNNYTDLAVDATYQYMANPKHIFEAKMSYIYEDQNLAAARAAAGDTSTGRTYLATYNLNLAYTFEQTYGVTFAYKKINGSHPPVLDEGVIIDQTRPNSQFYTAEPVYVPLWKIHFAPESVAEFAHQIAVYWLLTSQWYQC